MNVSWVFGAELKQVSLKKKKIPWTLPPPCQFLSCKNVRFQTILMPVHPLPTAWCSLKTGEFLPRMHGTLNLAIRRFKTFFLYAVGKNSPLIYKITYTMYAVGKNSPLIYEDHLHHGCSG